MLIKCIPGMQFSVMNTDFASMLVIYYPDCEDEPGWWGVSGECPLQGPGHMPPPHYPLRAQIPPCHQPPSSRPEMIREESEETEKEAETPEMAEGRAKEREKTTRKKKLTKRDKKEARSYVQGGVRGTVRLRRHPPSRSWMMSNCPPQRSVDL